MADGVEVVLTLLFNLLLLVFVVKLLLAVFSTKLSIILLYLAVLILAMALSGRFPGAHQIHDPKPDPLETPTRSFLDPPVQETALHGESEDGNTIAVSFWVAHPPQLSLFSVHCIDKRAKGRLFSTLPRVVGAHGPFVLLRAVFSGSASREFFLYNAAALPASLERIPSPFPDDDYRVREFGVLDGHRGHYLLAALRDAPDDGDCYELRIYSSEARSWSTRTLRNPCPGVDRVVPDRVITLGVDLLAWVDLLPGLLVCNIPLLLQNQHQDDQGPPPGAPAAVSFIPLPEPLPGNMYKVKYPIPPPPPPAKKVKRNPCADEERRSASLFRDLTCVNGGVLKFIEMENHPTPTPDENNIIQDSDLIVSLKRKAVDGNPKLQLTAFRDAWRAMTWTQKLDSSPSSNFWRRTCAAHVADIKGQHLALTEHYSAFPILSPDDDDVLYLRSLPEPSDREGSLVALDIRNKSLKAIGKYYIPEEFHYHPDHPFRACTLSRHLDMTAPGIQVSEYRKTTQASSSSADHPSETSIRMTSSERKHALRTLTGLDTKIKRAQSNSSRVHPAENNLPQLQCFNKLDYTPGHSLWANQNYLVPQPCFNNYYGASYNSCLLVQLGSLHLLGCSVSQHLVSDEI